MTGVPQAIASPEAGATSSAVQQVYSDRQTTPPRTRTATFAATPMHAVISGFILFHLVAILAWSFPPNSLLVSRLSAALSPYMHGVGLSQGWNMFAPNPLARNIYIEANITYRDGHSRVWRFPLMQDYGYYRRYFKERYRKWECDYLAHNYPEIFPDAARYAARLNNLPGDPPVVVQLVRSWSQIAPPPARGRPRRPEPWHHEMFFTYFVQPRDLR